jgi:hypothetical protein
VNVRLKSSLAVLGAAALVAGCGGAHSSSVAPSAGSMIPKVAATTRTTQLRAQGDAHQGRPRHVAFLVLTLDRNGNAQFAPVRNCKRADSGLHAHLRCPGPLASRRAMGCPGAPLPPLRSR